MSSVALGRMSSPAATAAPPVVSSRAPSRAEKRLAGRLKRGDAWALDAIHEQFGGLVFGYLRQALREPGEAEDVFQQVMTEVWRRGEQYDPQRAALSTWVMTIARSRAIDSLRRRRPEPVEVTAALEPAEAMDEEGLAERWRIAALLRLLSDEERDVLRLRFWEDLTQTEIADRTGVPLGTVKTRMVRALERLGEMLDADEARVDRRIAEGVAG